MQQLKYILGSILVAPLMPIVFFQGNRIRKEFPRLPEAEGPQGVAGAQFEKSMTVVGIGESSMAGVGIDTHTNGFLGQFSKRLAELTEKKINWHVYAQSGYTAEAVTKKLIPLATEEKADLFIIALGGNDTFQLNSPNKWKKECYELIQTIRIKHPVTPILFATMPPIHTFPAFTGSIRFVLGNLVRIHSDTLNKLIKNMPNVYYDARKIELKEWLAKYPSTKKADYYADGVHPSALTFSIWGRAMAELIDREHMFLSAVF